MIVTVTNQKGSVAKTTTVQALGAGLNQKGYKVLLVDLDPQANLTYAVGVKDAPVNILDVLKEQAPILEAICNFEQGDILPATPELAAVEKILKDTGREFRLREALEGVADSYDYIITDTPPSLGILTVNALTAAASVIIPAQADDFSLQGIAELYNTISVIRRYTNPKIQVDGILLTRHNSCSVISRDMSDAMREVAKNIGGRLYNTYIRECIALKEAQAVQQDIFTYAPKSNAAIDYLAFIEEVLASSPTYA